MNSALSVLRVGLAPFSTGLRAPTAVSDSSDILRAKQRVLQEHGGAAIVADGRSIMSALARFRASGDTPSFRELKYVCLGMSAVDQSGWCAISDKRLRQRVADLVTGQLEMRRRIRCFQALLSSYWSFPLNGRNLNKDAKAGWIALREWLRAEREQILKSAETVPPWFTSLAKHIALLSDDPCVHLGAALMDGDSSALREAMDDLAIPSGSWVVEEAVVAQLRSGCALDDDAFKKSLAHLIIIGSGRGDFKLDVSLKQRCVAFLVSRYAKCRERPEHPILRDAAIDIVGNPWLRRPNWDAWVVDERGKPDDQGREMINGWLKRRLITDFFELLSVDGTGDSRRVDYWLRFEPAIEDMWFALGADAWQRRGEQFNDFRSRAKGRLLYLDHTTADNNAFVMRVGRYLLVEFGAKGNAMFVFEWDALSQPLLNTLTSGSTHARVSTHVLKDGGCDERLIHRDSAAASWEQKFDETLIPRLGVRPPARPRRQGAVRLSANRSAAVGTFESFVQAHGLRVEDNRAKQGALWVLGATLPRPVAFQLAVWGFKLRAPKGWWKE
jgi:hypothetical protein